MRLLLAASAFEAVESARLTRSVPSDDACGLKEQGGFLNSCARSWERGRCLWTELGGTGRCAPNCAHPKNQYAGLCTDLCVWDATKQSCEFAPHALGLREFVCERPLNAHQATFCQGLARGSTAERPEPVARRALEDLRADGQVSEAEHRVIAKRIERARQWELEKQGPGEEVLEELARLGREGTVTPREQAKILAQLLPTLPQPDRALEMLWQAKQADGQLTAEDVEHLREQLRANRVHLEEHRARREDLAEALGGWTQLRWRPTGKTVLFLRHGESEWNHALHKSAANMRFAMHKRYVDSPLSATGYRQAMRLAATLVHAGGGVPEQTLPPPARDALGLLRTLPGPRDWQHSGAQVVAKSKAGWRVEEVEESARALQAHPAELEVLLGRRCRDTRIVASQLVRALDTLLFAIAPLRRECAAKVQISSDLQETEQNADCTARTKEGTRPALEGSSRSHAAQRAQLLQLEADAAKAGLKGEHAAERYLQEEYARTDVQLFTENLRWYYRFRFLDHGPRFQREIERAVEADERFTVMGGHSIWFRALIDLLGDDGCRRLAETGKHKLANTAVVAFDIETARAHEDLDGGVYRLVNCRPLYLGLVQDYKFVAPRQRVKEAPGSQRAELESDGEWFEIADLDDFTSISTARKRPVPKDALELEEWDEIVRGMFDDPENETASNSTVLINEYGDDVEVIAETKL